MPASLITDAQVAHQIQQWAVSEMKLGFLSYVFGAKAIANKRANWKNESSWERNLLVRVWLCVNLATVVYVCHINCDLLTLTFTFCMMCQQMWNFNLETKPYAWLVPEPRIFIAAFVAARLVSVSPLQSCEEVEEVFSKIPCAGFQMFIYQIAARVTWTRCCSIGWTHSVAILCLVSAQAAGTAPLCPLAQNPSAPGRWPPLLCLSDVASERDQEKPEGQDDPEIRGKAWSKVDLPLVKDQVGEHWNKLDISKSMWPKRMHPWLLRQMSGALWVHSWGSMKLHGDSRKFLRAKRKQMSHLS